MSDKYFNQVPEDEISIRDIIDFLLDSWKAILATGLIGLLGAAGFVTFTPSQYEATAQIQMAQIGPSNTNHLSVNVEDPSLLMVRLKLPSSYSEDQIRACGLQDLKLPAESLVNIVMLSPVKGANSIVQLKIRLESKDQAVSCTQSIFEYIRDSQNNIVKPFIEEAEALLLKYQARLSELQSQIDGVDKSGSAFLTEEIIRLNNLISAVDRRQARLIAPIYASDIPVFPREKIALLAGMLAGLSLGILFVMARKAWGAAGHDSGRSHLTSSRRARQKTP